MPVSITITRARTFAPGGDADNDGQADPGDVFLHTIILENLGTDPANNLIVTETENGLTIDPDSVLIGPIGVDDVFSITGNTPITFTLNQLLGNDLDPDDITPNLTINTSNVTNGSLVDNGDGTYTFTPTTGLDIGATAGFEYELTDSDGVTSVGSTQVTFNITDVVWYVDAGYGGANGAADGSYLRPFTDLTALNGANGDGSTNDDVDGAGETIFIYDRAPSVYSGGITLEAGQKLYGDGTTFSVNGLAIGASGNNTAINIGSYGVTLSTGNSIEGINFAGGVAGSVAIQDGGGTVGNLTIANTNITVTGKAIDIDQGGNLTVDIDSLSSSGSASEGIDLQGVSGTFNVDGGVIQGSTSDALLISGGNAAVTVNANLAKTSAGNVVQISNHSGGAITIGGTISATGGFDNGILIDGTTAGTISFTGATKTLNTGAFDAISITGTGAANITFGGGNLDIDTTTGTGINATNPAATLTISGSNNTVTTGAGRAISLDETDSGGIVLQSVTKTGGSSTAIFLDNAGSGGFTVTGTGTTAGSGGTIGGTITGTDLNYGTGIGFYANNTDNISLSNMTFSGSHQNFAIRGSDIDNFTLRNSTVGGTHGNTDVAEDEGAINFTNLRGVGLFEGNNISGGYSDNLKIVNTGGTLNLFVRDSATNQAVFGNNSTTNSGNDSILVSTSGTSQLFMLVDGVQFTGWRSDAIQTDANGQSRHEITVQNSQFNNSHPNIAAAGGIGVLVGGQAGGGAWSVDYDIHGNQFTGSKGSVIAASFTSTAGGTIRGFIDNNTIGTNNGGGPAGDSTQATTGSSEGGSAVFIRNEPLAGSTGSLTHYTTISNNQIRDIIGGIAAIYIAATRGTAPGASVVEATINNNNIDEVAGSVAAALALITGGLANEHGTIRAAINNNVFNIDTATPAGISGVYAQGVIGTNDLLVLPGFAGDFSSYLAGRGNSSSGPPNVLGSTDEVTPTAGNLTQPAPNGTEADLPTGAMVSGTPLSGGNTSGDGSGPPSSGNEGAETPGPSPLPPPSGETEPPAHPVIVDDNVLSRAELEYLVEAAIQRWVDAGATAEQVAAMRATRIDIAHMSGLYLGSSQSGSILIDSDGAGHGWFLDTSPGEDAEFSGSGTRLRAQAGGAAEGRMDLLTVLMHELGHQIGLSDDFNSVHADELMYGHAIIGERRLPGADDLAHADLTHPGQEAFVVTVPTIPVLPAGSAVRIVYTSTVEAFANGVIPSFVNFTEITYDGLATPQQSAVDPLVVDSLTLGGTIWSDDGAGGGTANNGILDGAESGIVNVDLSLLVDANNDNVPDSATAIATATTDANGNYSFAGLAEGNYIVRVDLDNFQGGGALASLQVSSLGVAAPPDPDNDVDDDDNGVRAEGEAAFSKTITLDYNDETVDDGTGQLDVNDTLDFGFLANPPPTLAGLGGDIAAFTEDGPAVLLDVGTDAVVTDNQDDFNGGLLRASITANLVAGEDVLGLATAGGVTLSDGTNVGSIVSVGGLAIGTVTSDGAGGDDLVVTFDTVDATPAAVSLLVQALTYSNSNGGDPSTAARTIAVTVDDGLAGTDTRTVTVTVAGINDAPNGTDSTILVDEDGSRILLAADFGFDDPDGAGDALSGVIITGVTGGGQLFFDADGSGGAGTGVPLVPGFFTVAQLANGEVYFAPDADEDGADYAEISFRVVDSSGAVNDTDPVANVLTIDVAPVNDAPTIAAPVVIAVSEDVPIAITGISFADVDAGSGSLTVTLSVLSGALAATDSGGVVIGGTSSTLSLTGTIDDINAFIADSRVTFTTAPDATSDVVLTVSIDDGGNSGSGGAKTESTTVTLEVTAVNDVPIITAPATITVTEDVAGALTGISFSDVDAGGGTVTVTLSAPSGALAATSGGGVTVTGAPGTLTLTGTIVDINAFIAGSAVTFTTEQDANADVALTVAINDEGNSGAGGPRQDLTTVTIDVTPVDDPAEARPDAVTAPENAIGRGNLFLDNGSGADVDVDGPALLVAAVNGEATLVGTTFKLASGARLRVNADGNFAYDPDGRFDFLAPDGAGTGAPSSATDSFTYTLLNGNTETVTVTIRAVDGNDVLIGTNGADILFGGAGKDRLFGRSGPDRLDGGSGNDQLFGEGGDDELIGGSGRDFLDGGVGEDRLFGGEDMDFLHGGKGADRMEGGDGNDSYRVDNIGDLVIEQGGGGKDLVLATISYRLPDQVENLTLLGGGDLSGRGNGLDNKIVGNSGDNYLAGAGGDDLLIGGNGDDILVGGSGLDTLIGGAGSDDFVFNATPASSNTGRVYDFKSGEDRFVLDQDVFTEAGRGALGGAFQLGATALEADDRILYDQATGNIYYDPDGTGAAAAIMFAAVSPGTVIVQSDFFVG